MSQLQQAIILKERIVYELAISLGIDPDTYNLDLLEIPDSYPGPNQVYYNTPSRHNIYLALQRNYEVLKKMKESLNNEQ